MRAEPAQKVQVLSLIFIMRGAAESVMQMQAASLDEE